MLVIIAGHVRISAMNGTEEPGSVTARTRMPVSWLVVALVLAAVLRLASWQSVFTSDGIRFLSDGDPYYHVIRAKQLAIDHRIDWIDPALNHPYGALVLWPPLFDAVIAVPSWVVGGLHPSQKTVEACAAFVPVVLGVAAVGAGAFLAAEILGGTPALIVAFLLAALPSHVRYSVLGRPDQHVLESLLLSLLLIVSLRGIRTTRTIGFSWIQPLSFALVLTASLWTWVGSPLHLLVLCLIVAVGYVLLEHQEAGLRGVQIAGTGSALATALLAIAALLFAPPGALGTISLQGVSGFHLVLTVAVAVWCGLIIVARQFSCPFYGKQRRIAEVVVAGLVTGLALWFVSADLRAAMLRGLLALGRGNEWYKYISEFSPLLFGPYTPLANELKQIWLIWGLLPLFAAVGIFEMASLWRAEPDKRPQLVVLALFGCIFTILLVYMSRFAYYSVVPLSLFAALGVSKTARFFEGRLPIGYGAIVMTVLVLAPCISLLLPASWSSLRSSRISAVLKPLSTGSLPREGGIMARWDMGHDIRYFSGLPVLASPFGTDGGVGAIEDSSGFFLETDEGAAEKLLLKRDIRYVLLADPANAVLESIALVRPADPVVKVVGDRYRGFTIKCSPGYDRLIVSRLFFSGGVGHSEKDGTLGGFRLVSEVGPPGGPPVLRLFEVVPGVRVNVVGARPGEMVLVRTLIKTPLGTLPWKVSVVADASGHARFRLPYASNTYGSVTASQYSISDGVSSGQVTVSNEEVEEGRNVSIVLTGAN